MSPRQSQTVVDTSRQSTTVPSGLPDSLRRCQTLQDGAKRSPRQSQKVPDTLRRCQEVFQTVSDGCRHS
ncbi:hypothetical protein DPMN_172069 [Dreissena polymorpha]|uniref:Uncharacterized protein n=1 Tax=Dreissena polymorpha TaxID=45954 RepID=A0A9D4E040_DREPO|nr:hypothetical protein DPMN_172069 [Dreissena polymorpha]